MSEYPWDFENMVLEQHDQPCDCAICDEIHFQRLMRRKRREEMKTSTTLNPDLAATVNQYQDRKFGSMSVTDQLNREIYRLREENERFKVMYKGFENQFMAIRERDAVISDLKEECKQLRIALKQEEDCAFQINQDLSSMREHCCQLEDINERLSREVKRLAP